jgi:hypothetical protein
MANMTRRQALLCSIATIATAPLVRPSVLEAMEPALRATAVPANVLWPGIVRFFEDEGVLRSDTIEPGDYYITREDYLVKPVH